MLSIAFNTSHNETSDAFRVQREGHGSTDVRLVVFKLGPLHPIRTTTGNTSLCVHLPNHWLEIEEPRSKLRGIFDRKQFCLFLYSRAIPAAPMSGIPVCFDKRRGMRSLLRFKPTGMRLAVGSSPGGLGEQGRSFNTWP